MSDQPGNPTNEGDKPAELVILFASDYELYLGTDRGHVGIISGVLARDLRLVPSQTINILNVQKPFQDHAIIMYPPSQNTPASSPIETEHVQLNHVYRPGGRHMFNAGYSSRSRTWVVSYPPETLEEKTT